MNNTASQADDQGVFLKTTVKPPIDRGQKTALNRKGNILFNSGDIEGARRIFQTTGYSDGLIRVGDYYRAQGRKLDALRMYWQAPDKKKSAEIVVEISILLKSFIHEEDSND
jgi:hypothetical protein